MKHYKIIENRPELTQAEILQGMNFTAIQNGGMVPAKVAVKAGLSKAVVIKIAVGLVVAASSLAIYKNNSRPEPNRNTILATQDSTGVYNKDTTRASKEILTEPVKVVAKKDKRESSHLKEEVNMLPLIMQQPTIEEEKQTTGTGKENAIIKDSVLSKARKVNPVKTVTPFKASPNASCKIWNTPSFCKMPKVSEAAYVKMDCDNCEFNLVSCEELNKQNGIKAVWLVVSVSNKDKFRIKTAFENFTLVRSTGESIHPTAMGVGLSSEDIKEPKFYSSNFKAGKLNVTFKKQIDIILFFDDPKPGDKIFIQDFIQAEIKE